MSRLGLITALTSVIALCRQECNSLSQLPPQSSMLSRSLGFPRTLCPLFAHPPLISVLSTGGSDALGFSSSLSNKGFRLDTQVIFGSNAIEHGINLLEERTQNILLVSGWNGARSDPLLWELEPRGFTLSVCNVSEEPTCETLHEVIAAALLCNCGAIIAMGCGSVIDSAKLATMLINTVENSGRLAEMSPADLETYLISNTGMGHSKAILEKRVFLVTVPALPSLGAELSDVVALRKIKESDTDGSNEFLPLPSQRVGSELCKTYMKAVHPDLSLVQPSLTYRAPMEIVHDRLIALIATSIDIILSDPGFMSEMIAWDSLRQLIILFDKAIECAEDRFTQYANDPKGFEEQTVHDDENDHRSQHFRRYGHGFDINLIEDLCRIGVAVASAKSGENVGGLQYLSDSLGEAAGCRKGHTSRLVKLFPSYIVALQEWCESDERVSSKGDLRSRREGRGGREDPYKAFIRTKLDRVALIMQTSKYLSYNPSDTTDTQQLDTSSVVTKEIIGETCGQVMPDAASNPQTLDRTNSGVLINQMAILKDQFRLLAGPMGEDEERDMSADGDSLTLLRTRLNKRNPDEINFTKSFDPSEFEKEEKANFTICGTIVDAESFLAGSDMGRVRSRRALPSASISEFDCYSIKSDMKKVCGDSPVHHLSVTALRDLLTSGYDGEEDSKEEKVKTIGFESNRYVSGIESSYVDEREGSHPIGVGDSSVEVEYSPINTEEHSVETVHSVPFGSSGGKIDTPVHSLVSEGPVSDVTQSLVSSDISSDISSISRYPVHNPVGDAKSAEEEATVKIKHTGTSAPSVLIDPVEGAQAKSDRINDAPNIKVTGSVVKRNVFEENGLVEEQNVLEDPTAAHRRKMKKLLAELTFSDEEMNGEVIVEVKMTSEEEEKAALLEQKTDVLARLLEQRIHDRWEKAKLDAVKDAPFNKIFKS